MTELLSHTFDVGQSRNYLVSRKDMNRYDSVIAAE